MGFRIVYLIVTKWLWDPDDDKPKKNTIRMGMHIIIKQMGIVDQKNWAKSVTHEKWLTMPPN